MTKSPALVGMLGIAVLAGLALFLKPQKVVRDELAVPGAIPPAALAVLKTKMVHHEAQMSGLLRQVMLLDDDGIARAAGEIFDEPELARPVLGDELNALLPERFFSLQTEIREHAVRLVAASARHDRAAVTDEFTALSKACLGCHEVYLYETGMAHHSELAR
jgi:hypothetical protein